MSNVHLPVLNNEVRSSLRTDGTRVFVQTADVRGRFTTARRVVFFLLIALWAALPWIEVGGHPAVFLDIARRQFFLFGATFNAQDIWLVFFLLTGVGFALVYLTAVLGRAWCGWACPQTVFLEAIFRPIERFTEGSRERRIRLANAPWSFEKLLRKGAKHFFYVLAAALVAHIFLSYFASIPAVFRMVRGKPSDHPEAFAWAMGMTALFYGNFSWFREQLCLIVCPYGRLQSVLVDDDSLVVGYDVKRGEPRAKGKVKAEGKGDCVDCNRCVVVCPTGIDIRNGLQLDCIACTACIDACDEVMDKLDRPRGLIRYDSQNGLAGRAKRLIRPRLYVYTALGVVGLLVASFAFRKHTGFEANILRLQGAPYVVEGGVVRNSFELHLVNKRPTEEVFEIAPEHAPPGVNFVIPTPSVKIPSLGSVRVPVFVTQDVGAFKGDFAVEIEVHGGGAEEREIKAKFVGPSR